MVFLKYEHGESEIKAWSNEVWPSKVLHNVNNNDIDLSNVTRFSNLLMLELKMNPMENNLRSSCSKVGGGREWCGPIIYQNKSGARRDLGERR